MAAKILLIDDEPEILLVAAARLGKKGYDVSTASSGEEGIHKAVTLRPDLIFLDQVMSEMRGDQVLKVLKQDARTQQIPVVMFTADIGRMSLEDYQALGATDCLFKPFMPEEILEKTEKILGGNV